MRTLSGWIEEKEAGILSAPAWTDDDMVVVLIWTSLQLNISMESNCGSDQDHDVLEVIGTLYGLYYGYGLLAVVVERVHALVGRVHVSFVAAADGAFGKWAAAALVVDSPAVRFRTL